MVTVEQLQTMLGCMESVRIERTISTNATEKFSEVVCAFANDMSNSKEPGYLLVGVRDDGCLNGLQTTDELLQRLAALRADGNILPQPALQVETFSLQGGDVVVVEVKPADLPPVRYKGQVWIRTGPRRAIANEQEERILSERRTATARTFDAIACEEAVVSDLALNLFAAYRQSTVASSVIDENHRSIEEQLAALRFYDLKKNCPTNAGILLFGTNPRFYFAGAYVQYLQFSGREITDMPIDQAEISGDMGGVMQQLDNRMQSLIQTSLHTRSALREEMHPNYPPGAIRELLVNALLHRDYASNSPVRLYSFSDRIEIQNPGGLYGEVTRENYLRVNSYRNPVLAEAMKTLGYVNRFGYGIQRAQKLLHENGNPPAQFIFEPNYVSVTLQRSGR